MGTDGAAAAATIKRENPLAITAIILGEGPAVTDDLRCSRVWVRVDTNRIVTRIPSIS